MRMKKTFLWAALCCFLIAGIYSCRKDYLIDNSRKIDSKLSAVEARFLDFGAQRASDSLSIARNKVRIDLATKNRHEKFIEGLVKAYGYPDWNLGYVCRNIENDIIVQLPLFSDSVTSAIIFSIQHKDVIKYIVLERGDKTLANLKNISVQDIEMIFAAYDLAKFKKTPFFMGIKLKQSFLRDGEGPLIYGPELSGPVITATRILVYVNPSWLQTPKPTNSSITHIGIDLSLPSRGELNSIMNGGTGISQTTETDNNPCAKAQAEKTTVKNILLDATIRAKKDELTAGISTATGENAFSFGYDASGKLTTTAIFSGSGTVGVPHSNPNFTVVGAMHIHLQSMFDCPSPGDIYALAYNNSQNSKFEFVYTFGANGTEYVLTVTDPAALKAFVAANPKVNALEDGLWNSNTPIGKDFDAASKYYKNNNASVYEQFEKAMAYVMKKHNMGVTLQKKDTAGNFEPMYVNETVVDPRDPSKNTYQVTHNCNQ